MMRRALYGRVLLLWGWAFGSQHYIDIGIDVDGGEAQLRATQSDEPQWAAMRFCETHALNASVEGLPCASLLAEEIIVHGGRYELRTSAWATTAAALGVPRADTAVAPAPYSLPLRRSDDRATVVRDACAQLGLLATACDALLASVAAAVPDSALGAGALYVPVETNDLLEWPGGPGGAVAAMARGAAALFGSNVAELRCATDVTRVAQQLCVVSPRAAQFSAAAAETDPLRWPTRDANPQLQVASLSCDAAALESSLRAAQARAPACAPSARAALALTPAVSLELTDADWHDGSRLTLLAWPTELAPAADAGSARFGLARAAVGRVCARFCAVHRCPDRTYSTAQLVRALLGTGADDEILARDATQREPRVVLSLSTLPGRIGALESMLGRLREQTRPADAIYVTLPCASIRAGGVPYLVPQALADAHARGELTLLRADADWGPATKLIAALAREQALVAAGGDARSVIVTVDDDILYPRTLVEVSEATNA